MIKQFSKSIIENIGSYVYCLIDPVKNEIFYIGKGKDNRVFDHLNQALNSPTESDKLDQIRQIKKEGEEPKHWIIRHGLNDDEAKKLEGALIDFARLNEGFQYNLKNLVKGSGSNQNGIRTVDDIHHQYGAIEITIEEPSLIIVVNRHFWYGMSDEELYEVTRKSWVLSKDRVNNIKYVFAVYFGIVREVYEVEDWFKIYDDHTKKDRYGFNGRVAPDEIGNKYKHQSAEKYKGNGNPLRYVNC